MEWKLAGVLVALWVAISQNVCLCTERVYYIACQEEVWDYAPGGTDDVYVPGYNQKSAGPLFLNQSSNRIGHRYKKAIYREYTDDTYSMQKPKPDWLGFLGPILKAEVGDTVTVHFKNRASRDYSMHAHGVSYPKSHEGAGYHDDDRTGAGNRRVAPGRSHTYIWNVTNTSGPSDGDPDCITSLYHSHASPVEDMASGLVGFLLICRRGTLDRWEETPLYALYVGLVDENFSWYLDHNIATYTDNSVDRDDVDFQESNKMHAINGYVYGHLPGLSACVGETIHWHLASLGSEVDIHSLSVSGHSFDYFNHSVDSVRLTPAEFVTAGMTALMRGKWLVSCQVRGHSRGGMEAFLTVDNCNNIDRPDNSVVNIRRYYIAAEEVMWDYAQSGRNKYDGGDLTDEGSDSEVFFKKDSSHVGGVYKKALFQEYTNFLFREKRTRPPEETHLGFLGPVIRAEVGDLVKVVFYNKATRPYSIHPHGVQMSKLDEGQLYNDGAEGKRDDFVEPNRVHTYHWTIPEAIGPDPKDPPCLIRMYTSGVDVIKDTYSGLVGPMLICQKGSLDEHGKQINVTKEFFLMFSVSDENKSWYLRDNINISGVDHNVDTERDEFVESNLMHGINGRLYGNLDGLDMCAGDVVSWHVFSVGAEVDVHTVKFRGHSFLQHDVRRSSSDLLPGSMRTLAMVPRHPGSWGLSCGSQKHYKSGIKTFYTVRNCGNDNKTGDSLPYGRTVRKFIQAVEQDWNYLPHNSDLINNPGVSLSFAFSPRIGWTYKKALYREYTDGTFTTPKVRSREEAYLGILGPIIRLEVGDVLEIKFKNSASVRSYSVNAQGLLYTGSSDEHSMKQPLVRPGDTFTYTWNVTTDSGPGPGDPECIASVYYSDVDFAKDANSGLIGPLVVCRRGALKEDGGRRVRKNVNKDFAVYFSVMDENQSWYIEENLNKISGVTQPEKLLQDERFRKTNLMHSINGYAYGNQPAPVLTEGETVDWYFITMGTNVHSVHFHGNDVVQFNTGNHTKDVIQVFPAAPATARMHALNPGKWLYYCHVNEHFASGMQALYDVQEDLIPFISK